MDKPTQLRDGQQVTSFFNVALASRLGGVAGLLGVVLGLAQAFGLAAAVPAIATILLILPNLCVIFWLAGVYAFQSPRLGRLGSFGLAGAVTGLAAIILINLLQNAAAGSSGGWARTILANPSLPLAFTALSVLFVWGILALGTTSLQTAALPQGAVVFWMVGMMASLLTSWPPVSVVTVIGVLWSSIVLLRRIPNLEASYQPEAKPVERPAAAAASPTGRLLPLDALRGLIMILMAIDHASLFIRRWHPLETWDQPLPDYPSLAAMLTRLATHPCAPGFYFLMGVGMILFAHYRRQLGWSERRIAGHLALRGLLFIALEQLIVDVASSGKIYPLEFSILSGLGGALLFGILFLRLSVFVQAAAGAAILLVMQFLPELLLNADLGVFSPIRLFILPGSVGPAYVLYPPIPWLGIVLLGMAFARLQLRDEDKAYQVAAIAGLAGLVSFLLLRALGGFGNLRMPAGKTLVDFFNVVKYPPSLSFLCLSLGFNLAVLYLFSRISSKLATWGRPVVVLGQAALYFFLAHWFIYAAMSVAWSAPGGLPQTYLAWLIGLILLYPVCKVFEAFKHTTPVNSVWRMI